jgi:hypothetical protein
LDKTLTGIKNFFLERTKEQPKEKDHPPVQYSGHGDEKKDFDPKNEEP